MSVEPRKLTRYKHHLRTLLGRYRRIGGEQTLRDLGALTSDMRFISRMTYAEIRDVFREVDPEIDPAWFESLMADIDDAEDERGAS